MKAALLIEYKKQCSYCGEYGGRNGCGFYIRRASRDGLSLTCRKCISIYGKKHRIKYHGKIKKRRVLYRKNNREKLNAKQKEYYKNNREKIRQKEAERYYKNNREKIIQKEAERREKLNEGNKKQCSRCGELGGKDGSGFYLKKRGEDKRTAYCKVCAKKIKARYLKTGGGKIKQKEFMVKYRESDEYKRKQSEYFKTDRWKNILKNNNKRRVESITDGYVRGILKKIHRIEYKDITPEMIEAKRELLTLHRLKKEINDGINSARN